MLKALLLSLMNPTARAIALASTPALAAMAMAQNLVPNPSFEDTVNCELPVIGIRKALNWYTANSATPDVWDSDLDRQCGFPLDSVGFPGLWYISPYQGLRHAGEYFWFGPGSSDTREYIMAQLSQPLETGAAYEVSLWVALSGTMEFAVDHIGVWFGQDSLFEPDADWLNVVPQLKLRDPGNAYLQETESWTQLRDTLVAQGGERWMVIGNFDLADSVNGISAYPEAINSYAYYYIDEVKVRPLTRPVGMEEHGLTVIQHGDGWSIVYPDEVRPTRVLVCDAMGRSVREHGPDWSQRPVSVSSAGLAPGVYILTVVGEGQRISARVIKEEGGR